MREEVGVLRERRDAAGVRRGPEPRAVVQVEQRRPVEIRTPRVGVHQPRDDAQQRGLAGAVGPEDGDGLAGLDAQIDGEAPRGDRGREREGHGRALRVSVEAVPARWARPTTITATTISTSERATAASGSTSRCR